MNAALLQQIQQGKGLKKTHVNDRSAPQVAGSVAGAAGGAGGAAATGRPPAAPRPPAPAPPVPSGNDPASQLAGLFAGGMPALRKTGDRAASGTGHFAKPPPIPSASKAPSKPSAPPPPPPPPSAPPPPLQPRQRQADMSQHRLRELHRQHRRPRQPHLEQPPQHPQHRPPRPLPLHPPHLHVSTEKNLQHHRLCLEGHLRHPYPTDRQAASQEEPCHHLHLGLPQRPAEERPHLHHHLVPQAHPPSHLALQALMPLLTAHSLQLYRRVQTRATWRLLRLHVDHRRYPCRRLWPRPPHPHLPHPLHEG
ncbi:hypothetical protein C366_03633 [Cryptococcus neoformans Tu401-1]|nr:hypothetical protein C366_03633 [Cryptococcus neoformans var. grubii Tu401-1]